MAERVIILSGPPGGGKTTVSKLLVAESAAAQAAHIHSDDFFHYIQKGFIPPWDPSSQAQNAAVTKALARTACAFAEAGIEVVLDGVVGPWFLDAYRDAAGEARVDLRYVVLRPDLSTAMRRVRRRELMPLHDYPANVYDALAHLGDLERCVIDTSELEPSDVAAEVMKGLSSGRFRAAIAGRRRRTVQAEPGAPSPASALAPYGFQGHDT